MATDKPRRKRGGTLGALALLTLIAAAAGGGLGIYLEGSIETVVKARDEKKPVAATPAPLKYTGDVRLATLQPVVANLADPPNVWLRLQTAMIFKNGAVFNPDATAAKIAEDIVGYVHTLRLAELQGPSGWEHLREDLNDRVAARTGGAVDELVIETMVVQ